MKADKLIATYRRLRHEPVWRLLAADHGPTVLGLLQTHLYEAERSLPASLLHDRIGRDLDELRGRGESFPQTAQQYVADWLADGYLERRLLPGAREEEYELSAAAVEAIRLVQTLVKPHTAATESRLALVMSALQQLADDTDTDKARRVERLRSERDRIDAELAAVEQGAWHVLPDATALERVREIIRLADGLAGDFRRVRDQFERLNRELREQIMENEGSRGEVLDSLFAGIDLIGESEAGRTFAAFWQLLNDPEQSAALDTALDEVLARRFAGELERGERRFLLNLTRTLLDEGSTVNAVMQTFSRSLKQFVQSREFLEQRRLTQLLREAQRAALAIKDDVHAAMELDYSLTLTSSRVRSISQWLLHDPSQQAVPAPMAVAEEPALDLETVTELIAQSEIDFRSLREHVTIVLATHGQASIADVLTEFPAEQGLGSVIGLLALGHRHGVPSGDDEIVSWVGGDGQRRQARIPQIFFLKESFDESA